MKHIITAAIALMLIQACSSKKEEQQQTPVHTENIVSLTDAQIKNAQIDTGLLQEKSISGILKVNGIIDVPPQNAVSVSVPLGGYLKSTKLLPGMHIAKGEVIAVLEDVQYIQLQQDYLTAKAQLSFAEADFNRQRELNKNKTSSDKVFEQANATYKSQRATVKALEEKLQLLGVDVGNLTDENISRSISLRSPINGYVSDVNVNVGKYVNPTDVLFELVNPDDIHLSLTVFEKDLDKLSIGQKVMAYTNNNADKKYPCEIILVGKHLSDNRSTEVHCHFDKYDKALIPGMYMNAEIAVVTKGATVLPEDAVVDYQGVSYVFTVKGYGNYELQKVEAGIAENGYREVNVSTLDKGVYFVTKNAYTLFMKMKNTAD